MTQPLTQRLDAINALMLAGDATDEQVNEALRLVDLADAAPDLLESLDELLAHIEWRRRSAGEKTGPNDCTHRARAALAKAKAGAP